MPDESTPDKLIILDGERPKVADAASVRATIERPAGELGVLSETATNDLLERRSQRYRQYDQTARDFEEMIVFRRCGVVYAVEISTLSEIQLLQRMTVFPPTTGCVKGVINVRGRIVSVHDLARFAGRDDPLGDTPWVLVAWHQIHHVAIVADDVEGVRQVSREDIREVPASMHARRGCYRGIDSNGMIIIDLNGLIENQDFFYA